MRIESGPNEGEVTRISRNALFDTMFDDGRGTVYRDSVETGDMIRFDLSVTPQINTTAAAGPNQAVTMNGWRLEHALPSDTSGASTLRLDVPTGFADGEDGSVASGAYNIDTEGIIFTQDGGVDTPNFSVDLSGLLQQIEDSDTFATNITGVSGTGNEDRSFNIQGNNGFTDIPVSLNIQDDDSSSNNEVQSLVARDDQLSITTGSNAMDRIYSTIDLQGTGGISVTATSTPNGNDVITVDGSALANPSVSCAQNGPDYAITGIDSGTGQVDCGEFIRDQNGQAQAGNFWINDTGTVEGRLEVSTANNTFIADGVNDKVMVGTDTATSRPLTVSGGMFIGNSEASLGSDNTINFQVHDDAGMASGLPSGEVGNDGADGWIDSAAQIRHDPSFVNDQNNTAYEISNMITQFGYRHHMGASGGYGLYYSGLSNQVFLNSNFNVDGRENYSATSGSIAYSNRDGAVPDGSVAHPTANIGGALGVIRDEKAIGVLGYADLPFDTIAPENVYAGYFQGNVGIQGNLQLAGVVEGTLGVQNGDLNVAGGTLNAGNTNINGNLKLAGVVDGTLGVNGDLNIAGGTLNAGNTNINGNLKLAGVVDGTLGVVNGDLNVADGTLNANNANINNLEAGNIDAVKTITGSLHIEDSDENDARFELRNEGWDAANGVDEYRGPAGGSELVLTTDDTSGGTPSNIGTDLKVYGKVFAVNGAKVGLPTGPDRVSGTADDDTCNAEMYGTIAARATNPGLWVCLDVGAGLEWRRLD
jgi:cytoskeletal protein CcmA (bactofilin family)